MQIFVFVSCILLCNGFLINTTASNVECKEFEKDNVKVYGLKLKSSSYTLRCYEDDGQSNCLSLFGKDREYCQKVCCHNVKESKNTFAIECKEFAVRGQNVRGFSRKTPPFVNVPCFEENGIPNCEALFEPERNVCRNSCCNGSSVVSLKKEWLPEEKPVEENQSNIPGCSQSKSEELLWWEHTSYALIAVVLFLLITCTILLALLFKYRKHFKQKERISQPTDEEQQNERVAFASS